MTGNREDVSKHKQEVNVEQMKKNWTVSVWQQNPRKHPINSKRKTWGTCCTTVRRMDWSGLNLDACHTFKIFPLLKDSLTLGFSHCFWLEGENERNMSGYVCCSTSAHFYFGGVLFPLITSFHYTSQNSQCSQCSQFLTVWVQLCSRVLGQSTEVDLPPESGEKR